MPKRKRDDDEENGSLKIEDQALRIRVSRLVAKVALGHKSIASALKLARGFERQKLGRRQKAAQQEPKNLLRLREEVIVLKQLDLVDTAKKYLFKQLVKTKRIKESPAFIRVYGGDPEIEGPEPGASANVVGRLFNSNPVKEVMPGIMSGIYSCLGIEERQPGSDGTEPKSQIRNRNSNLNGIVEDEFQGFSGAEVEQELNPKANRSVKDSEDVEFLEYGDRLASSSDELEEAEEDTHFQVRANGAISGQNHDRQASEPFSDLSTALSISGSPSSPSPHAKPRATKSTKLKTSSTSFLPSLINGGYYSGSESNDDEADQLYNNSSGLRKVRNNRRGQRARQQIAEKKYGKNAKHLAKQETQAVNGRDGGWDAQRGATDANGRKGKFGRNGGSNFPRKTQGLTGASADAVKGRAFKAKSDGPLHPSWEAAKKRKEEQKPSLAFSGKKIMFD